MIIRVFNIDYSDAIYMFKKINKALPHLPDEVVYDNKYYTTFKEYKKQEAKEWEVLNSKDGWDLDLPSDYVLKDSWEEEERGDIEDYLMVSVGVPVVSGFKWEEYNEKE